MKGKENHERHLKLSDVPWRIVRNIYKENRRIFIFPFSFCSFCDLFFATSCDLFEKKLFSFFSPRRWKSFLNSSRLFTNQWLWVSWRKTILKLKLKLFLMMKVYEMHFWSSLHDLLDRSEGLKEINFWVAGIRIRSKGSVWNNKSARNFLETRASKQGEFIEFFVFLSTLNLNSASLDQTLLKIRKWEKCFSSEPKLLVRAAASARRWKIFAISTWFQHFLGFSAV